MAWRANYDSEGAAMIPDSASPISSRRFERINPNRDHDIQDRYASPSMTRNKNSGQDQTIGGREATLMHILTMTFGTPSASMEWIRPDMVQSGKRLSGDVSTHFQGQVQPRASSDLGFDYTNVPRGPRIDKGSPHIFIPASAIPPSDQIIPHLSGKIKRSRPSAVEQDHWGYYIFFGQHARSAADLQACFDAMNGEKLFGRYTMDMQVFFDGQDVPLAKDAANEQEHYAEAENKPHPINDQPQSTAEHTTKSFQIEDMPMNSRSAGGLLSLQAKANSPTRYTPSESSSRLSATHSRKCQICKKVSPLDSELLIICSTCKRAYHKGCHTRPAVSNFNMDWQCGYCNKKKTALATPTMDMAVSTNVEITTRPSEEGQSPPHKRVRRTENPAPEAALSSAISNATSPLDSYNGPKRLASPTNIGPPLLDSPKDSSCQDSRSAAITDLAARVNYSTVSSSEISTASTAPQHSVFCFRQLAAIAVLESGHYSLPFSDLVEKIARQVTDASHEVWRNDLIQVLVKNAECETPLFQLKHRHVVAEDQQDEQAWCTCTEHAATMAERPHLVSVSLRNFGGLSTALKEAEVQNFRPLQSLSTNKTSHTSTPQVRQDVSKSTALSTFDILAVMNKIALPRVLTSTMHHDNMNEDAVTARHMYETKMDEIRARPNRKAVFGTHISRLGSSGTKDMPLNLRRQTSLKQGPVGDGKDETMADVEAFDSIEELLDLPDMVVPMIYKDHLTFRDANQTYDGRLRRPKGMFEVESGDSD